MDKLRKIMLVFSVPAFAVCCLYLNLLGGIGILLNADKNYSACGVSLLISVAAFAISLTAAFFRKGVFNIISLLFNIAGTICYIYPLGILNGIPNERIPKADIEVLTSRIYPSVIVTVFLAVVIFADFFSYDRSVKRMEKRQKRLKEKSRALTDEEKII